MDAQARHEWMDAYAMDAQARHEWMDAQARHEWMHRGCISFCVSHACPLWINV